MIYIGKAKQNKPEVEEKKGIKTLSNQIARKDSSMYIGFKNIPFVFFSIGQTVHHTTISTRTTTISITGTEKRSGAKVHHEHTPTMREKKQKGASGEMDRTKKKRLDFFAQLYT